MFENKPRTNIRGLCFKVSNGFKPSIQTEIHQGSPMQQILKYFLFATLFLASTFISSFADENLNPVNTPVISANEKIFHHGTVMEGDKLTHIFAIQNKGDFPLILTGVTTDCSCTTTHSDKKIMPGQTGRLEVVFDTAGAAGETVKTISVSSNDPRTPVLDFKVQANIVDTLSISPDRVFFNGLKGHIMEKTVTIARKDHQPFKATFKKSMLPDQIGFYIKHNKNDNSYTVYFKNKAETSGTARGRIFLTTDLPERPLITIPVFARIVDPVQVVPRKIDFGSATTGQNAPLIRSAAVISHTDAPLEILSAQSERRGFSIGINRPWR